jgi:hypothetical protein
LDASDALRNLLTPYLGNPVIAVKQVESGWHHHPEALVPALAGMLLENRQPHAGTKPLALLQMQVELYQLAADSPSMMPQLERLARYLAAQAEFDLSGRQQTNSFSARMNCLVNVRHAVMSEGTSAAEYRSYCEIVLALGESELARELASRWEGRFPEDPSARRSRIQAELSAEAFGPALKLIDRFLADNPTNAWAVEQRQNALAGLKSLADSISRKPDP